MNGIKYLIDDKGNKTSVVLSMEDWRNLSSNLAEVKALENIVKSVKEGLAQAKQFEQEKRTVGESTEDFLNGL